MIQEIWQIIHSRFIGITYHAENTKWSHMRVTKSLSWRTEMVGEKSGPSFAYILTDVFIFNISWFVVYASR